MSEKFSAALRIGDLNDYIAPSQACIVSLKGLKKNDKPEVSIANKQVNFEPVKISLKDCLACSGCVTSAETVMLEKQSLDEFLNNINSGKAVIVSLSPQSRASIAVHFGISPIQAFKKLTRFFKSLGVKAVFDTSCSRDLTLVESCVEFITRYRQNQLVDDERSKSSLPMIASACPGWICYAEKQLGSFVLPYISSVKSPQQTIGVIIKNYVCQELGLRPEEVYHVTVMPCYDKKLEAARDDFVFQFESHVEGLESEINMISEVDSVLTTGEVLELIQSKEVDFKSLEETPLDKILTNINEEGYLYGVHGSSGGYAETIFRYAAKTLFGRQIDDPLTFRNIRNSDFQEVTLEASSFELYNIIIMLVKKVVIRKVEGKTVLKFALCYGFRNLQNIVRKLKNGKCDYHFLEIMACPSGCLNGGGQIKPNSGQSPKELSQLLESVYMENVSFGSITICIVKGLYDKWLEQPGSVKARRYMHTQYHPVEKSITSQLHNW
ncbi:Cytosolic Fe-S cluster assembly factor NARFL [Glycine soja]|uniref:Cytosolic Fe-S cluster assembly factor NARFL n=1 Tax=Glycine soja TaxID=3848 RepID=A0A0B2SDD3_GLYSO|nr:Cytosolic Fe-S cluster assembly factor NARFL [Glycine soja]